MGLVTITYRAMAGLAARVEITGRTRKMGQIHAHMWAKKVARRLGLEIRAEGLRPDYHGVVLVANHRSYLDIPVILSKLPCSFLAKAEVKKWPVLGRGAELVDTIFVTREDGESRAQARDSLQAALARGLNVVVFAEGTTSAGPGLLPFKKGSFEVAAGHGHAVVPVAVSYEDAGAAWVGDDSFLPHFLKLFRKPRLRARVSFGPVLRDGSAESLLTTAAYWINSQVGQPASTGREMT